MHLFTADSVAQDDMKDIHADAVETAASGLLYHAGSGRGKRKRVVTLPRAHAVTSEWGEIVCAASAPCVSFETSVLGDAESVLYWLN